MRVPVSSVVADSVIGVFARVVVVTDVILLREERLSKAVVPTYGERAFSSTFVDGLEDIQMRLTRRPQQLFVPSPARHELGRARGRRCRLQRLFGRVAVVDDKLGTGQGENAAHGIGPRCRRTRRRFRWEWRRRRRGRVCYPGASQVGEKLRWRHDVRSVRIGEAPQLRLLIEVEL